MARRPQRNAGTSEGDNKPKLTPAPTHTVTDDLEPDWKAGQQLTTWDAHHRYFQALVEDHVVTIDRVKEAFQQVPHDEAFDKEEAADWEVAVCEWLEANTAEKAAATEPRGTTADHDPVRAEMMELGSMLDETANANLDRFTGQSKEDLDGSAVAILEDVQRIDKEKGLKGKMVKTLTSIVPDSRPIGYVTRKKEPHPKALPSGSNARADYYYREGESEKLGSRIQDFCDGTAYGNGLNEDLLYIKKRKTGKPGDPSRPEATPAEEKRFLSRWTAAMEGASWSSHIEDTMEKKIRTRLTSLYNKTRLATRLMRQWEAYKNNSPEEGELNPQWVHKAYGMKTGASMPLKLVYTYTDKDGDRQTEQSRSLSVGTFCSYDIADALKRHRKHANFIEELAQTVKREAGEEKGVKSYRAEAIANPPGMDMVAKLLEGVGAFMIPDKNEAKVADWLNAAKVGDTNKAVFASIYDRMMYIYNVYVQSWDLEQARKRNKASADESARRKRESEAMAKGHDVAA